MLYKAQAFIPATWGVEADLPEACRWRAIWAAQQDPSQKKKALNGLLKLFVKWHHSCQNVTIPTVCGDADLNIPTELPVV